MPLPDADSLFDSKSDLPDADALFSGGKQPDTASADAVRTKGPVRRGLSGLVDTLNPLPILGKAAGTITDFSKDAFDARNTGNFGFSRTVQNAKSAADTVTHMVGIEPAEVAESFKKGDALGVAKGFLHNPALESIGEKVGEGNVAGAGGEGAGIGLNAYLMGGGKIPGADTATSYLKNKALDMYQRASKPQAWFKKLPIEQQRAALRQGVENWVPPTESGKPKVGGLIDEADAARQKAEDALQNSGQRLPVDTLDQAAQVQGTQPHAFSPTSKRISGLEDVQGRYADIKFEHADPAEIQAAKQDIANKLNAQNAANPPQLGFGGSQRTTPLTPADITDAQVKAINYPSTMEPADILSLKREFRKEIATPEGHLPVSQNGAAVDSFINHMAGTAGDIVKNASPELKQLGLTQRDLINLETLVKDSAFRVGKREFGGVATPVAAGVGAAAAGSAKALSTVGRAAMVAEVIRSPYLRSKLASMLYHSSGGMHGLATANAILETLAHPLDMQEDQDQRNSAAVNAKQ